MRELQSGDLIHAIGNLPKKVQDAMGKYGNDLILAGGYIRSMIALEEKINDIDLFTSSKELAADVAAMFDGDGIHTYVSDNAYTIHFAGEEKIQIIHRWTFERPEDVIESFDYTIAQAAIWFDSKHGEYASVVGDKFYEDLAAKRLKYLAPTRNEDSGGSFHRAIKFVKRGYAISDADMGKVLARMLTEVPISSNDIVFDVDTVAHTSRAFVPEKVAAPRITQVLERARRYKY